MESGCGFFKCLVHGKNSFDRVLPLETCPPCGKTVSSQRERRTKLSGTKLDVKLDHLNRILGDMDSAIVAFSGGVDSALLLYLAHEVLGERCLGLTAQSETLPFEEMEDAIRVAKTIGAEHVLVRSNELDVEGYRTNPTNRCYYCKTELYALTKAAAAERGIQFVLDGTNLDDLGDHRPGRIAAAESGVRSPFVEAECTKEDIRSLSKRFGLETWKKAEFACLGSRFPYGTEITADRLVKIGACETALRKLGFHTFRARFHDDVVRLELSEEELVRAISPEVRRELIAACKAAGFRFVTLDLQGYRRGSLNEGITTTPSKKTAITLVKHEAIPAEAH